MRNRKYRALIVVGISLLTGAGCADGTRTYENAGGADGEGGATTTTATTTTGTTSTGGGQGGQGGQGGGQGGQGGGQGGQGGQGGCATDADCTPGQAWCVGGACVPCDNSAPLCDIQCPTGWNVYKRNGCLPCACAPMNECNFDGECPGMKCYAGQFCWDWCPPGDPSCCFGNVCETSGCPEPNPAGCMVTGCPEGQSCSVQMDVCTSSNCVCDGMNWSCNKDCGGGSCAP